MIRRTKQNKFVINVSSVICRFEFIRTFTSQICSWKHKNAFAKVGPRGDPISTPSICLSIFPLKLKKLFYRAALKCFSKSVLLMLLTLASLLNKESQHTLIVSSNGMLVKRDSTSRPFMKCPGPRPAISLANSKMLFTVYILVVIGCRRETSNLARLYVDVLIADIIGLKGGQLSTNCFWTLQRP